MKIEERLVRRQQEDIIEIGNVLNRFYSGQGGVVLRAIINGLISEAISNKDDVKTSAERRLGWAEGYQTVINSIERAIQDMQQLTEPLREEGE